MSDEWTNGKCECCGFENLPVLDFYYAADSSMSRRTRTLCQLCANTKTGTYEGMVAMTDLQRTALDVMRTVCYVGNAARFGQKS